MTLYLKIHLINVCRTITATSRRLRRDNSGIVYIDGDGTTCYGRFQKLLLFENDQQQHAFVVIQRFRPAIQKLCKEFVTTVGLDDHISTLHAPRLVTTCILHKWHSFMMYIQHTIGQETSVLQKLLLLWTNVC